MQFSQSAKKYNLQIANSTSGTLLPKLFPDFYDDEQVANKGILEKSFYSPLNPNENDTSTQFLFDDNLYSSSENETLYRASGFFNQLSTPLSYIIFMLFIYSIIVFFVFISAVYSHRKRIGYNYSDSLDDLNTDDELDDKTKSQQSQQRLSNRKIYNELSCNEAETSKEFGLKNSEFQNDSFTEDEHLLANRYINDEIENPSNISPSKFKQVRTSIPDSFNDVIFVDKSKMIKSDQNTESNNNSKTKNKGKRKNFTSSTRSKTFEMNKLDSSIIKSFLKSSISLKKSMRRMKTKRTNLKMCDKSSNLIASFKKSPNQHNDLYSQNDCSVFLSCD